MSRKPPALAALAVGAGLILSACGEKRERVYYDPPADPAAAGWSTFVIGDPARLRVPPPPAAGSAEEKQELRELSRLARDRDLAQRRDAFYWALEPTVRYWIDSALNGISLRRTQSSPAAARAYALVSVAMYDAAVAAWHWKYEYRRKPPRVKAILPKGKDPSYPSEHAAIGAAAARVLRYAFPERPSTQLEKLAREKARSRVVAGTNFPSDARAGVQLGRAVADAVIRRARADGSNQPPDGLRPPGPGSWEPPPGSRGRPEEPAAGRWRPWVLGSGNRFRPAAPAGFDSAAFKAEAQEVLDAGKRLAGGQRGRAQYWGRSTGTPLMPGTWNQIALTRTHGSGLSVPRAARVFAFINVAMADAGIAAWDAKYTYWTPRPENAIRDLRLDRSWRPYVPTPLSPGYVSGNAAYAAAAGEVLARLFPREAGRFRRRAAQAARFQVLGGTSFPRDVGAGRSLGRKVGELVARRANTRR